MPLYSLDGHAPETPGEGKFWVAPDAHVVGKVVLEEDVGIWFGAVIRGDFVSTQHLPRAPDARSKRDQVLPVLLGESPEHFLRRIGDVLRVRTLQGLGDAERQPDTIDEVDAKSTKRKPCHP